MNKKNGLTTNKIFEERVNVEHQLKSRIQLAFQFS